jgi:hypothetical protein
MELDVMLVLTASATARPGGDSGGSARRGGERGWQRLRQTRAGGSARVGAGSDDNTRSIVHALAPAAGAGRL